MTDAKCENCPNWPCSLLGGHEGTCSTDIEKRRDPSSPSAATEGKEEISEADDAYGPVCPVDGESLDEHCDTDINAAGVHREYWLQCPKCHAVYDPNDSKVRPATEENALKCGCDPYVQELHEKYHHEALNKLDAAEAELATLRRSHEALVKVLEKSPHLPNCRFRERLCSQPNCSEIHVTPCSCGRDAALDSARDLQPIHAAGPLNP